MIANFSVVRAAVAKQFQSMIGTGLFYVDVDKDALWEAYLASFPDGTNPTYRARTEHDCSACKSFIRAIGGVVTIRDGKMVSLWDCQTDAIYQPVVDALARVVHSHNITNIFLHKEPSIGVAKDFERIVGEPGESGVRTWEHFFVNLPAAAYSKDPGPKRAEALADHDVLLRSLTEIDLDSIDTVLELIDQNSLYRGEENRHAIAEFRKLKLAFSIDGAPDLFAWTASRSSIGAVTRIRNTAIGTLLSALSAGEEMEGAVKAFEAIVALTNYERPTALVTKAMIEKAKQTIEALGFTSALERRYATIDDITVANVLFADRQAKREMNVFDELSSEAPERKNFDKVDEITIEAFLTKVLPKAEAIDVLFENRLTPNLVSLIAPVDPTAKSMFKWPNNFSWAYAGEVADSIKERVKRAGGSITGDLCCRLAWNNTDDLDFHMVEPRGNIIYYPNKRQLSSCGGVLDLDANGGDGIRLDPAENIAYADRRTMREGIYELKVHQYARRETVNGGFEVEVEFDGTAMKTEEASRQLSGVGFSSTQRNSVLCRVSGAFSRTVRVTF